LPHPELEYRLMNLCFQIRVEPAAGRVRRTICDKPQHGEAARRGAELCNAALVGRAEGEAQDRIQADAAQALGAVTNDTKGHCEVIPHLGQRGGDNADGGWRGAPASPRVFRQARAIRSHRYRGRCTWAQVSVSALVANVRAGVPGSGHISTRCSFTPGLAASLNSLWVPVRPAVDLIPACHFR
jgi:hypothetical protein